MVEANRLYDSVFLKKPKVILDKRFEFAKELEVGSTGQLEAEVVVLSIDLVKDNSRQESKVVTLFIVNAARLDKRGVRG